MDFSQYTVDSYGNVHLSGDLNAWMLSSSWRRHGLYHRICQQEYRSRHGGPPSTPADDGDLRDLGVSLLPRVLAADILVIGGPIWLGDNSSVTRRVIERLYGYSGVLNEQGQYSYYGRVGGCLLTGNEDGLKHCAMSILFSLQHIGYTVPPQADAGWLGEVGPGPSYLDEGSGGPENDFTNRNIAFMTYNLMHLASMLRAAGGIPAYGNQRTAWDAGTHPDHANPEYR